MLQEYLSTFQEMGVAAYGIVAQRPEKVRQYMAIHGLSLPILIDADRAVTKRYGVYHPFGVDAFRIARPSTFLIGLDGKIYFIYVGENQNDRPHPQTIFAELRKLRA